MWRNTYITSGEQWQLRFSRPRLWYFKTLTADFENNWVLSLRETNTQTWELQSWLVLQLFSYLHLFVQQAILELIFSQQQPENVKLLIIACAQNLTLQQDWLTWCCSMASRMVDIRHHILDTHQVSLISTLFCTHVFAVYMYTVSQCPLIA